MKQRKGEQVCRGNAVLKSAKGTYWPRTESVVAKSLETEEEEEEEDGHA